MSHALAIDFGGTKVEAALISDDGIILEGSRLRAPTGSAATSQDLQDAVQRVVQHALDAAPG